MSLTLLIMELCYKFLAGMRVFSDCIGHEETDDLQLIVKSSLQETLQGKPKLYPSVTRSIKTQHLFQLRSPRYFSPSAWLMST